MSISRQHILFNGISSEPNIQILFSERTNLVTQQAFSNTTRKWIQPKEPQVVPGSPQNYLETVTSNINICFCKMFISSFQNVYGYPDLYSESAERSILWKNISRNMLVYLLWVLGVREPFVGTRSQILVGMDGPVFFCITFWKCPKERHIFYDVFC